jgi:VWFA-related protein
MKPVIISLVLLSAATLAAQVSETIDVRIVNVDVTVTSKGGPVRGLTRDDFEIFEDGRRQVITNFYASEETPATAPATASGAAPAVAQPEDSRFRRKVLVLVDSRHTTRRNRDAALRELEAMINDRFHGEYEWSIGVMGRRITLVLPLSSDKQAIHEALEIIRRSGTRGEGNTTFTGTREADTPATPGIQKASWSAFDRDYADRLQESAAMDASEQTIAAKVTVPAYLDAVRGFASTSGRKIILLLTGDPGLNPPDNFPHEPGNGEFTGVAGRSPSRASVDRKIMDDLRRSIVEEANASDTSFYIWNVEGLMPGGEWGVGSRPATDTSAISWLSKQTGGRLVTGNDPARAVRDFDTASSTFYSLGYSPSHPDDGKYHSISVRLKRGDYSLDYRTGYSATPSAAQLARAMTSPTAAAMQANAFPVTLSMGTSQVVPGGVSVPIEVKVPFRSLQFLPGKTGVAANLVVYVSVFNDMGKNLVASSFHLTPGFKSGAPDLSGMLVYRNAISLRTGERHRVVVAVRDVTTDSVGMATEVVRF